MCLGKRNDYNVGASAVQKNEIDCINVSQTTKSANQPWPAIGELLKHSTTNPKIKCPNWHQLAPGENGREVNVGNFVLRSK